MTTSALTVRKLFCTPLLLSHFDGAADINRVLLDHFLPRPAQAPGRHHSNLGGWQSEENLQTLALPAVQVIVGGADFDAAKAAARAYAQQHGSLFIEDGDDRHIAEGAGTIAREICDAVVARGAALDALIRTLGNGALLTGMAVWMKAHMPACRVIWVVAAHAPAIKLSWE